MKKETPAIPVEPIGLGTKNAIIESVRIGFEDRGFLDCWLSLDYGGSGQGFGGFTLYLPKTWAHHNINSPAGHFIFRCMEVAGVVRWDDMKGKAIRVRSNHSGICAIGHIIKDDWFCPAQDFASLKEGSK